MIKKILTNKELFWTFLYQLIIMVGGLVLIKLLATALTKEIYGYYALIMSITALIVMLPFSALMEGVSRYSSIYQLKSKYKNFLSVVILLHLFMILVYVVLFVFFKNIFTLSPEMCFYPMMMHLDIMSMSATELFREEAGGTTGIGSIVENIRNNVYIFSFFAILIRAVQTFFEPILSFVRTFSLFEDGDFALYQFQQLITNFVMIPYFLLFFKKLFFIFKKRSLIDKNIQTLFLLLFSLIILIGGFSFIHNRYLYPLFPLLIMASLIPKSSMIQSINLSKA